MRCRINTTELFARPLCGFFSHQLPVLAAIISSSSALNREIRAALRIPPAKTASAILQQAKIDGVKVFELLDTLKGMDKVQLSYIVTEVLNNKRTLTSSLGYKVESPTNLSEKRNIMV